MKIQKIGLIGLCAGVLMCGTTAAFAAPPPPPPGRVLVPGMMWCPRCGGHGRVPSGFLGWTDKRCPECKGFGMFRPKHAVVPPPPPPPPRHVAPPPRHVAPPPHHPQPHHPGPQPHHGGPKHHPGPGPR